MHAARLLPLLVDKAFVPGSVTTILEICNDWFRDEASLASFVFRAVFCDLSVRNWDDDQGVPTSEFELFKADVLPRLNAVLTTRLGDTTGALNDLLLAHRSFLRSAERDSG